MHDPVITKHGHSYDRATIVEHLKRNPTDPLTREPLQVSDLRPNLALKKACDEFWENNAAWAVNFWSYNHCSKHLASDSRLWVLRLMSNFPFLWADHDFIIASVKRRRLRRHKSSNLYNQIELLSTASSPSKNSDQGKICDELIWNNNKVVWLRLILSDGQRKNSAWTLAGTKIPISGYQVKQSWDWYWG